MQNHHWVGCSTLVRPSVATLPSRFSVRLAWLPIFAACLLPQLLCAELPEKLQRWLRPQVWERDTQRPVLSLGESGKFDDTHIFAPSVARMGDEYWMWYCGSSGFAHDLAPERKPDERVFRLGLAVSSDGRKFERHSGSPVFALPDPKRSVLTPTVLRSADGNVLREDGKLRMWFCSGTLGGGGRVV